LQTFLLAIHIYYMNDLKAPIDTLKEKIEQLISSHAKLTERLKNTEDENANLAHLLKEKEAEGAAGMDLVERNNVLTAQLAEKEALLSEMEANLKSARAENAELVSKLKDNQSVATLAAPDTNLIKQLEEKDALLAEKENQLKESGLLLKELGEKNKLHNLAQSISSNTGSEQNEELKLIITDLVKEIDKCITLLGKNV
jgi:DNA repair exonuclease SbcCD ATPase subunit